MDSNRFGIWCAGAAKFSKTIHVSMSKIMNTEIVNTEGGLLFVLP